MTDSKITLELATTKNIQPHSAICDEVYHSGDNSNAIVPEVATQTQGSFVLPGYNAPADVSPNSQQQIIQQQGMTGWLTNDPLRSPPTQFDSGLHSTLSAGLGQETIPTLQPGKPANQADETVYQNTSQIAQLTDQNRNSVVQVYGKADNGAKNSDFAGSGFFLDNQGDLATAFHVIRDIKGPILVDTADGVTHQASIVAKDPASDLAILSIGQWNQTQAAPLELDSSSLHNGDPLVAMGHPEGWPDLYVSPGKYAGTTTLGNLADPSTLAGASPDQQMIAAQMNTEPGDSGAPVFNAAGKVVGLVDRGDNGSHGYMVPSSAIMALADGTPNKSAQPSPLDQLPSSAPQSPAHGWFVAGSLLTASNPFISNNFRYKGTLGSIGVGISGYMAAHDLFNTDLHTMTDAYSHGSMSQKIHSTINVAADGLMLGATAMKFITPFRGNAVSVSLLGSTAKILNNAL